MSPRRFATFAWGALAYNLAVIVWGAYVRASGSGAGCGRHWPLCNGEVVPRAPALKTIVEFSHRATSGLVLVVAAVLVWAAFRAFPRGSAVRRGAVAVLGLTLTEALIGAGLVLFELVAHDTSMKRAMSMSLHLVNTFFLLGALTLTAYRASRTRTSARTSTSTGTGVRVAFVVGAAALLLVGMSGGIAALGDTLFPATSFADGLRQELSTGAHLLLRLRVLHPIFAVVTSLIVIGVGALARALQPSPGVGKWSRVLSALVMGQLVLGVANIALLAPIAVQLLHLLLADAVWIAFILLYAEVTEGAPLAASADAPLVTAAE